MFYKVVSHNKGKLYSANAYFQIEYKKGEWIKPEIGKLFIFNDIDYAEDFRQCEVGTYNTSIFSCDVLNPIEYEGNIIALLSICGFSNDDDESEKKCIKGFWNGINYDLKMRKVPSGTYVCDQLKLIEELC